MMIKTSIATLGLLASLAAGVTLGPDATSPAPAPAPSAEANEPASPAADRRTPGASVETGLEANASLSR